jgi:hypothetical protein
MKLKLTFILTALFVVFLQAEIMQPVMQLRFDGDLTDTSSNSFTHNATLSEGSEMYTAGANGQGIDLDMTNNVYSVANHAEFSGDFSLSLWVRSSSNTNFINGHVFLTFGNPYNSGQPGIRITAEAWGPGQYSVFFRTNNNTAAANVGSIGNQTTNSFSQIVITYDSSISNLKVYFNGALAQERSDVLVAHTDPMTFGKINTKYFNGVLDQIRFFTNILTSTDVGILYLDDFTQITGEAAPADVPVMQLKFDGDLTDTSSNGAVHDATVNVGDITYSAGTNGQALDVDLTNSDLSVTYHPELGGDFTASLWVKYSDSGVPTDTNDGILGFGNPYNGSTPGIKITAQKWGTGQYAVWFATNEGFGTGARHSGGIGQIVSTSYSHIAVVYDSTANTITVFFDGTQVFTDTDVVLTTTDSIRIGSDGAGAPKYFNGLIDHVRWYNGVLSPAKVAALYADDFTQITASTAPTVTVTTGPATDITTNASFDVELTASATNGYWSTNGSTWTEFATTSGTITIATTTTLQFYGDDKAGNVSTTNSVVYTFDTVAPSVSVASGPAATLTTNQAFAVTLTNNEASGYYSTNGTDWIVFSVNGTNSGAISIATTLTLSFYGADVAGNVSATNSYIYTIDPTPSVTITTGPSADISTNASFNIALSVVLTNGYWSTNNWVITNMFTGTTAVIAISNTTTLQYYGDDKIGNVSVTNTVTYTFDTTTPIVSVASGPVADVSTNAVFTITLESDEANGYYTTNALNWVQFSVNGTNSGLISVATSMTLSFYGRDEAGNVSATSNLVFVVTLPDGATPEDDVITVTPSANPITEGAEAKFKSWVAKDVTECELRIYSLAGDLVFSKTADVSTTIFNTAGDKAIVEFEWTDRSGVAKGTYIAVLLENGTVNKEATTTVIVK